jgi:hypothetical protein
MAEDRNDLITKVTARVLSEMSASESAFEKAYGVTDLRAHVSGLGKGAESAWEITYKTSAAVNIEQAMDPARLRASLSAWEISYKTSSAPAIEQIKSR